MVKSVEKKEKEVKQTIAKKATTEAVKKEPTKKASTTKKIADKPVEKKVATKAAEKKTPVKKAEAKATEKKAIVKKKVVKEEKPYEKLAKEMKACIAYKAKNSKSDAKRYLKDFATAEALLVMAQQENIQEVSAHSMKLGSDVLAFYEKFFSFAYSILKTWQYADVDYYQNFAFAIVAQYKDMFDAYQMRIQMDCADLFILQGDEGRGDADYHYLLRENEIKDYIYYRFASIYASNDNVEKAKQIGYDSLHCVDERYTYYPKIQKIINN